MITLMYPTDQATRYLFHDGIAFGPYDNKYDTSAEPISFDSSLAALTQTRGIYGENTVIHDKLTGDVEYIPLAGNCVAWPTAMLPDRIKVPVKDYGPVWYTADAGLGVHLGTNFQFAGSLSSKTAWQWAVRRDDVSKLWTYRKIQTSPNNPTLVNGCVDMQIMKIEPYSGHLHKVTLRSTIRQGLGSQGVQTNINWFTRQSYDTIMGLNVGTPGDPVTTTVYKYLYEADLTASPFQGPQSLKQRIDMLVGLWFGGEFPIPERNFGDMAMEASSKVNANHTNMIAFIKDLRHPTELIPKLKNLRNLANAQKLKNAADDYLTVKYGILPTISDLKEIVAAMSKTKPYKDKMGFDTYSSGYIKEETINDIYYSLTQHIKLAVGDEDSAFQELASKLDSLGVLPTCKNLWDLVPYSFVVDWFINVGDLLERVDTNLRIQRLNIKYVTQSRKTTISGDFKPDATSPFHGSVDWVHYHRWVSDQCPVPPLTLQSNPQDFNHWLESFALLIQRAK